MVGIKLEKANREALTKFYRVAGEVRTPLGNLGFIKIGQFYYLKLRFYRSLFVMAPSCESCLTSPACVVYRDHMLYTIKIKWCDQFINDILKKAYIMRSADNDIPLENYD